MAGFFQLNYITLLTVKFDGGTIMAQAIVVKDLSKVYKGRMGDGVAAVDNISFEVNGCIDLM